LAKRVAVLLSGAGSNFRALLDAQASGQLIAEFVGVFSDRADAAGLAIASAHQIPAFAFERKDFQTRAQQERALFDAVAASNPDLIVLAGFMRVISAATIDRIRAPMLNLHPSLLPKYPGLHTHQRAIDAGDKEHGASVHVVTADLDAGPLLAQARIDIYPGETPEALAARLKPIEHKLLLAAVKLALSERVSIQPTRISVAGIALNRPLELCPDAQELHNIDASL
jgi:phosphoribosylglycinamide formyltransferase 1